jgi:hypothetical protein
VKYSSKRQRVDDPEQQTSRKYINGFSYIPVIRSFKRQRTEEPESNNSGKQIRLEQRSQNKVSTKQSPDPRRLSSPFSSSDTCRPSHPSGARRLLKVYGGRHQLSGTQPQQPPTLAIPIQTHSTRLEWGGGLIIQFPIAGNDLPQMSLASPSFTPVPSSRAMISPMSTITISTGLGPIRK